MYLILYYMYYPREIFYMHIHVQMYIYVQYSL